MILFLGLFGCFDSNKTNATSDPHPIDDPMCDAICNEQSIFDFSKALDAYQVSVSFLTSEGTDTTEVPTGRLEPTQLTARLKLLRQ